MSLSLKATKGPLSGQSFPLKNGLTIGRQGATINLGDPRASAIHGRVVENGGRWWLEDNNSKNGIRSAAGERVSTLELKSGASFSIGETTFLVESSKAVAAAGTRIVAPAVDAVPSPVVPIAEKPKKKQVYWNDALAEFLESHAKKFKDKVRPIHALNPALILEFVRGAQVNSRWVIGFGPRKIGPACLDLPIWETGAPPICFEIFPSPDGLLFKTDHTQIVKLNGSAVDSQVLRMGDTITINETLIEVDFTE